jgi:hypothetical protein
MLIVVIAFWCGAVFDLLWVSCVNAVREQKPIKAANLSLMLYGLTMLATVLVVQQEIAAIIAYGLGNWLGTYFAVKR